MAEIKLSASWRNILEDEFSKEYMKELKVFLSGELKAGKKIFPQPQNYFAALNLTPFENVKVVILGQDPYHGLGQAHGLCFSVQPGVRIPPSLVNIYKELKSDLGISPAAHGNLQRWAGQGVLLLNNVLTVEEGKAASHAGKGWERFTDRIVHEVNHRKSHVAFLLWGSHAQKKASAVDRAKHFVLESPHPSPLSAHRGFLGSRPFSRINDYLVSTSQTPIDWRVDEATTSTSSPMSTAANPDSRVYS